MDVIGLQSEIRKNKTKSIILILLFPTIIFFLIFVITKIVWETDPFNESLKILSILGPVMIIWLVITLVFHQKLLFKFSWAKTITRKENPKIYNIVENLCISKGLPVPKIGILEDNSLNAFAVGRKPGNSRIVFSKGLIEKLNKEEIEAVAAHELTHIINKDWLLMAITILFIWIVGTLWEILLRFIYLNNSWNSKKNKLSTILFLLWIGLIVLWYLFFPVIKLAISRKREFLADFGSVQLTKNNEAMINALKKISDDPLIESIDKKSVASMFIYRPLKKPISSFEKFFKSFFSTHPDINNRIEILKKI